MILLIIDNYDIQKKGMGKGDCREFDYIIIKLCFSFVFKFDFK